MRFANGRPAVKKNEAGPGTGGRMTSYIRRVRILLAVQLIPLVHAHPDAEGRSGMLQDYKGAGRRVRKLP
jgi:hypothetical protein